MRRTQALLYHRLAEEGHGYASSRMTLTRPDGQETSQFLVLTESERALLDKHLEPVLDTLSGVLGSRAAACRSVMARLATDEIELVQDGPTDLEPREARS